MNDQSNVAELWLERRSPESAGEGASPQWLASAAGACVFLHGDGVSWAQRSGLDANLLICSASWQRRFGQQQPASGTLGSLMVFWARALLAERMYSSAGQSDVRKGDRSLPWLLRYRGDESSLARREALELVMAGASLDLKLALVLERPAWSSFSEDDWQSWKQLTDHQLADLYCRARPDDSLPPGITRLSSDLLDRHWSFHRSLGI